MVAKLKRLKPVLKQWNWTVFGNIFTKLDDLRMEIAKAEEDQNCDAQSLAIPKQNYKDVENFDKQKVRNKWLKQGDRNTAFFHQSLLHKGRQMGSLKIQNEVGEEIEDAAIDYFRKQLTVEKVVDNSALLDTIPRLITHEDNDMLLKMPNSKEIKEADFSTPAEPA